MTVKIALFCFTSKFSIFKITFQRHIFKWIKPSILIAFKYLKIVMNTKNWDSTWGGAKNCLDWESFWEGKEENFEKQRMAEVAKSRDARRRRRILDQGSDRLAFITGRIQTLPPTLPDSAASSTQSPPPNTTLSASGTFLRFSPSIPVPFVKLRF